MSDIKLWLGDCLERMSDIADGSVDAIICDLPYGTTACKWDTVIPFEPLWKHYKRVIKRNGAIVLFGSQPFTSALVMSNLPMFRYEWIWDKGMASNFASVKHQPLKYHENILVFSRSGHYYQPQLRNNVLKPFGRMVRDDKSEHIKHLPHTQTAGVGYPKSIISITRPNNLTGGGLHPTQKPVALMEYLIRTYTNEGETVLDNCMGSGSTLVACVSTNRNGIGIEKYPLLDRPIDPRTNPNYFYEAQARIQEAQSQARQLPLAI